MHGPESRKFKKPSMRAMLIVPLSSLILIACATNQRPALAPTSPSRIDGKIRPLACTDFPPMTFSTGKPGVTVDDVLADLKRPDSPLGWARTDLGDTMSTRAEISAYVAARKAIGCE